MVVVTRYLRRAPRRSTRVTAGMAVKDHGLPVVTPEERAAMARALAYFCVACGRQHVSGDVREADICCAEMKIDAVVHGEAP